MVRENVSAVWDASDPTETDYGETSNVVTVNITEDVASGDTTININDASDMVADMYLVTRGLEGYEVMQVTSVDANAKTIDVTRGLDGTTAVAHKEDQTLTVTTPAKSHNQLVADFLQVLDHLGTAGGTVTWDRNLILQPSTTDGTYPLTIDVLSGHADPEPFIDFRRSTDSGTTYTSVGSLDYDPTNDDLELTGMTFVAGTNADILLEDDQELRFGTEPKDYWFTYDSTNTQFELNSTDVDGGGSDGIVFRVPDGGDDIIFEGGLATDGESAVTSGVSINGPLDLKDDNQLLWGSGDDYWAEYDATGTQWRLRSTDVDGGGSDGTILSVQDGSDDAVFEGGLSTDGQAAVTSGISADGPVRITDDNAVELGTDTDHLIEYDSANAWLQISDGSNDAIRVSDTSLDVDVVTGNLDIVAGTLDVGGTTLFENDRDLAVDLIPNAAGSLDLGSATREWANLYLGDDAPVQYGADQDWLVQYDSANAWWELSDGTNDAIRVADTSLDVDIVTGNLDVVAGTLDVGGTTVLENDRDVAVDLLPNASATLDLGSSTRYWNTVFGRTIQVENQGAGGDATLTANTGGRDMELFGSFLPSSDNAHDIGSVGRRWTETHATQFMVEAAQNDSNPTVQLDSAGLKLGAGAGSALDLLLKRASSTNWQVRDAADSAFRDLELRTIRLNGGTVFSTLNVTASGGTTTISLTDTKVYVDASSATETIQLPASPEDGEWHLVKRNGANTVTVSGNGNNIDGAATFDLTTDDEWIGVGFSSTTGQWEVDA